jgi:DNA-binding response OmpR family regulator
MNGKILIVEDHPDTLQLLQIILERNGYETVLAPTGSVALERIQDLPDLVLLDVMMPDVDGHEICRRLRDDPKTAHIPVLMLTARALAEDRVQGFEAGTDDYLSKPIQVEQLVTRVKSLLKQSAQERQEARYQLLQEAVRKLLARREQETDQTRLELEGLLSDDDLFSAKIEYQGRIGLVIRLGQRLSDQWGPGDTIVFWDDGSHGRLPEAFNLIALNLFVPETE